MYIRMLTFVCRFYVVDEWWAGVEGRSSGFMELHVPLKFQLPSSTVYCKGICFVTRSKC